MSGIEVAGLTLGALPLLISAIESYNEGLDPIKSFIRWERELPQLIRKLRNEHVHFAQTMRLLLEPITTEFELADMLAEPAGPLWKDHRMVNKLQDKLQESFGAYQNTMADVDRIMKKIAGKLDLERASELTRNDLEAIIAANPRKNDNFEFRKRLKFGMSKKTIKALLGELADCNKELERFTDRSDKFETIRKSAKPSFGSRFQKIQELARDLHSTILSSWSCSCRPYHTTSLQLEQREALYLTGSKRPKPLSKVCFTVSFTTSSNDPHPWTWQDAKIHIEDEDPCFTPTETPPARLKMTKSVSFGDKPPPPYSLMDPSSVPPQTKPTLQEIRDLCASIQQLHRCTPCIGLSLNSKSKLLRGIYPIDGDRPSVATRHAVSLGELLSKPPLINGRPAKLSKKERYFLAVTLASSALQLCSTPWFPDQWSVRDIVFQQNSSGHCLVDIDRPYVASKLAEQTADLKTPPKTRGFQNKNTILLALAVTLLELYFGMSAEQRQAADGTHGELVNGDPWQLCALAYDWAETEQENLSAAFSSAVNHCLRSFSDPSSSLKDKEFLQAAVESIVLPLQDELYQFLGRTLG
ncbi:hypothetical protein M011DRAFT_474775 [Sporormia fimetaria CBS 119925]|uniref:DUF7580 domain-containing protein n=1 Tax=Sporormia fimetaria CBS 119925 TaxID=1340428 RepID=A0A6A6VL90_9PLEO|nr:hypothetical protein M011DRAFT_474775 [Sporormia fimetaria CBS 119925]